MLSKRTRILAVCVAAILATGAGQPQRPPLESATDPEDALECGSTMRSHTVVDHGGEAVDRRQPGELAKVWRDATTEARPGLVLTEQIAFRASPTTTKIAYADEDDHVIAVLTYEKMPWAWQLQSILECG